MKYIIVLITLLALSACDLNNKANNRPVAIPGTNQMVEVNTVVLLDGSASEDIDGDVITYTWKITSAPAGSSASLSNSGIFNPTFRPTVTGVYSITLVVNDGKEDSPAAQTEINVGFIGTFSRTFIENGETNGVVTPGTNMKETSQFFNGDNSTLDYNNDGTPDITYEEGSVYLISTTYTVDGGVDTELWKLIIKVISPEDLSDATLLVIKESDTWQTSGGWYDGFKTAITGVTNSISSDGQTLTQTSAGGNTVNNFQKE